MTARRVSPGDDVLAFAAYHFLEAKRRDGKPVDAVERFQRNHEAFANEGTIAASRPVRSLLKPFAKSKLPVAATAALPPALPPPPIKGASRTSSARSD